MKTNYIYIAIISISLLSCGHSEITKEITETNSHEQKSSTVELSKEQLEMMKIEIGSLERMNLSYTIETNGTLELPPQNKATISAIMSGKVSSILVTQGDKVKKGQVLAYIENPDFIQLQQDYLTAKNNAAYLEKEYNRTKSLKDQEIASDKSFSKIESEFKQANFTYEGLKSQLQLLNINLNKLENGEFLSSIPVRSPINGYVRLIEVNLGKYVLPELALFEVVDNEHLHLDLLVYEKDIAKVHANQNVHFTTSSNPNDILEGKIFAVGKAFEKDVKAVKVHAEILDKRDYLIPGMYVNGHIELDSNTTTVLPREAVVEEGNIYYIFCQVKITESTYTFEKVEVITGAQEGNKIEVQFIDTKYLTMPIVLSGAYYLLAELNKEAVD